MKLTLRYSSTLINPSTTAPPSAFSTKLAFDLLPRPMNMKSASIVFPLGRATFLSPFCSPNDPSHSPSPTLELEEGMVTLESPTKSILRLFRAPSTAVDNFGLTRGACQPCGDPLEFTLAALEGLAALRGRDFE